MFEFSFPDTAKYKAWTDEFKVILEEKKKRDDIIRRKNIMIGITIVLPLVFDLIDRFLLRSNPLKNKENEI